MNDPTYVKSEIEANPDWELAWTLSEILNDNAPIGWGRYIYAAKCLRGHYHMQRVERAPTDTNLPAGTTKRHGDFSEYAEKSEA